MSFWSAIVAIIAILAFTATRIARYKAGLGDHRDHRHALRSGLDPLAGAPVPAPRDAELQREVEDLRQRIKVLERIATEDRHSKSIAAEIESLRDS